MSIHCLAGGACEVIDFYAKKVQGEPFVSHILNQNPDLDMARVRRIQRQFWTAFKHATRKQGKGTEVERDDEELLGRFTDDQNDTALFIGWTDYARATGTMPIEAQVHQAWFLAKHPDKLNPMHSKEPCNVSPRDQFALSGKTETAASESDLVGAKEF